MVVFKKLYFITGAVLILSFYSYGQSSGPIHTSKKLTDTLFIGVPNCSISQFGEVKTILSTMPDAKLVYACEEEKRFMLLIKRKTYPDISFIQEKVRVVNNNLIVYEKTGGWISFFSLCKGEIVK